MIWTWKWLLSLSWAGFIKDLRRFYVENISNIATWKREIINLINHFYIKGSLYIEGCNIAYKMSGQFIY